MKSVEQQMQTLARIVRQLQTEVDGLKSSGYQQSYAYTDTGNGRRVYPHHTVLDSNPNGEELFDEESAWKDMHDMAVPLTYRETQILNYVADGTTNKQIAYILGISEQTIKNHMSAILRKLHANDRAHAVALAMRDGWLPAERALGGMVPVS